MAKRQKNRNTTGTSENSLINTCAFWGLVLAGVAGLISFMLYLLGVCGVTIAWGNKVAGACSMIAQLAIYIAVWLAAWRFARGKGQTFGILFWVFFVLSLLGLVGLGIGSWY